MLSLESQRQNFNIVISDLSRCNNSVQQICDSLSSYGFIYYAIVHDKDRIDLDTLKRTHLHIVIQSFKRLRAKQVINYLCDICSTNFENVRVDEVISLSSCVQYLLHLNDCNKYQYPRNELLTNKPDDADALLLETSVVNELTTTQLIDYIFNQKLTRLEIIGLIGIGRYQHYRATINDLIELRDLKRSKNDLKQSI